MIAYGQNITRINALSTLIPKTQSMPMIQMSVYVPVPVPVPFTNVIKPLKIKT